MPSNKYEFFKEASTKFGLVPFGITGKHYLKSPTNKVGIEPKIFSLFLISFNVLSIAS